MRKLVILAMALFMLGNVTYGQARIIEHKVTKGDTVSSISREYNVTPSDIYRLNPNAVTGINVDAVLKVPVNNKVVVSGNKHTVAPKETLFSISQKYAIKQTDLELANKDVIKDGLKSGSILIIPNVKISRGDEKNHVANSVQKTAATAVKSNLYHTVEPKETKFGVAKRYGLSVQELEDLNPQIVENLEKGDVLRLNKQTPVYSIGVKTAEAPAKNVNFVDYVVQPKETLFSLARMSDMSTDNFLKLNPELKDGVKTGMVVKIPSVSNNYKVSVLKPQVDLTNKIFKKQAKNLVLLLPFNAEKVGTNKTTTIQEQLKKDKFLNMTLDFYAGALVAIDSAKKLGLPLKVQILDSKETKASSNIVSLVNNGSFNKADAVVGPFFQNHVETLAGLLESSGIPVISPLSTEKGRPMSNLYQAMPNSEDVKKKMIDFMFANNGNIVAVVDSKKGSVRKYLTESFPTVKIAALKETGMPDADLLKASLVKDRTNYIVLETESTGMVINTCKTLINLSESYPIQLVTLDKNETLEFDEVPLDYLVKLKLLYPTITRENDTKAASIFSKNFKKYNNVMPSKFATRGFDVTFDTILRLFNEEGYKGSVEEFASEQIENKFNFISIDGSYYNKGVYLMYFDSDLTVKEAN